MGAGTVHFVDHCGMQPAVARVEGHVHHIPGLKHQVADLPGFAILIAAENKGAFASADKDEHFIIAAG